MSDKGFHMIQLYLNTRRVFELGRRLKLFHVRKPIDLPYLVHCALGELFQELAPRPYSVENATRPGPWIRVLGYADVPWEQLKERAQLFADPDRYAMCDWERGASKPMPAFPNGMRLGFNVRLCPVVRKVSQKMSSEQHNGSKDKLELDIFLDALQNQGEANLDREAVYSEWFAKMMARPNRGGARVEHVRMVKFKLEPMIRRTQGEPRSVVVIRRPDVVLEGVLTVTDSEAFQNALRHGVGRHRHFGYGMIKLRRA